MFLTRQQPVRPSWSSAARVRRRLGLCVVAGVACLASPSAASAEWQRVAENAASTDAGAISVGPTGTISQVFGTGRIFGRYYGSEPPRAVAGTVERRGSAWDTARTVITPARFADTRIAHGSSGAAALWNEDENGVWRVSSRTAKGAWSDWGPIGPDAAAPQVGAQLAIDRSDRLVAVWRVRAPGSYRAGILMSMRPVAGGTWSAPVQLGEALINGYEDDPAINQNSGVVQPLLLASDGTLVAWWTSGANRTISRGGVQTISPDSAEFARVQPDGTLVRASSYYTLPDESDRYVTAFGIPEAATIADDGTVTTTILRRGRDGTQATEVARLAPGTAPTSFDRLAFLPGSWELADLGTGRQIAVARVSPAAEPGTTVLEARTTVDGGRTWSAPQRISPDGRTVDRVEVAVNRAQGVITLGLQTGPAGTRDGDRTEDRKVVARDWFAWDDSFSRFFEVPYLRGLSTMQIDGRSDSVFGGVTREGPFGLVVDDASGPEITGLTAPARLRAGRSGTFAVKAVDAFSGLGKVTWDFGDGTSAEGATVRHAFSRPGTRTVSVTATDESGYATATSTTVRVTAAGTVAASVPLELARTATAKPVTASGIRLAADRLSLRASGAAHLLVTIQRRTGTAKRPGYAEGPVVRVQPTRSGTIVARVPGISAGATYRVRVRADVGSLRQVRRLGVDVRAGR